MPFPKLELFASHYPIAAFGLATVLAGCSRPVHDSLAQNHSPSNVDSGVLEPSPYGPSNIEASPPAQTTLKLASAETDSGGEERQLAEWEFRTTEDTLDGLFDIVRQRIQNSPKRGVVVRFGDVYSLPDSETDDTQVSKGKFVTASVPQERLIVSDEKTQRALVQPDPKAQSPIASVVATEDEKNQRIAEDWPVPKVVFYITGQQHGYLEPCGCTGLSNQKGGLNRRDTLLSQIKARGWTTVPIDAGNQIRRIGRQAELKFLNSAKAFRELDYKAVAFGPDDLRIGVDYLMLAMTNEEGDAESPFVASNVSIFDDYVDQFKIIETDTMKIGITSILETEKLTGGNSDFLEIKPVDETLPTTLESLQKMECDYKILIAHTSLDRSRELAMKYSDFDLVVTAGGFGEPTYKPEEFEGIQTKMVQVGVKGMYVGLLGIFENPATPVRYQRIALSSQFEDSDRITEMFAKYQDSLRDNGFAGLGLRPALHRSGREFVGSETCGECHTTAYEIWEGTPHSHATDSIVTPPERSEIARHFDPECLSCHVTGWNPQDFLPYKSGYESLELSAHLVANGCENCHGPGSAHVAAEYGDVDADEALLAELRNEMRLPYDKARDKCLDCHDIDNSPDFHHDGAFEEYWDQVKHYGKD